MKVLGKINNMYLRNNRWQFLLLIVSIVLTIIWFWSGRQLAGGEEGFSIFNERDLFPQISLWQETGTGYLLPIYVTRLIPLFLAKLLKSLNLAFFVSQALFYFTFICSGLVGFYLLSKEIFKNSKKAGLISVSAALFYFFNLYSQSQIFGRFLYSSMALWSLVPIFLFFWIRWIESAKMRWLIFLVLASNIFSLAFLQPAHVFAFWTPPFLWTAIKIFKEIERRMRIIMLFLIGAFSWIISSLWWIYPYLKLGSSAFEEKLSREFNLSSLAGVSQYFTTKEIILLRQSFLFGPASSTFEFYSSNWVYLASAVVFIFVLVGIVKLKKINNWSFILVTLFVGWFVSKGSNPPLGKTFFEFLFSNSSLTQSLRNPYEKFGLVFLIPYSLFFGAGLTLISSRFKTSFSRRLFFLLFIFISCVFLVWPIWNGDVFTKSLYVNTPLYYEEANAYLSEREDDGRVLQFPIIPGDSVKYTWGYQGVEPSEFLFDKPAVSKILKAKYFDDKYWELEKAFIGGKDYNHFLDETNVRYLILHNDLIPQASGASSSAQTVEIFAKNPKIHLLKKFGELEIYKYTGNVAPGIFILENKNMSTLDYKKLSPIHYTVNIQNANKPFRLIFKETYNDLWEARIGGKKLDKHFLIYDYANGWEIDKTGDYNIEIVFKIWPWE